MRGSWRATAFTRHARHTGINLRGVIVLPRRAVLAHMATTCFVVLASSALAATLCTAAAAIYDARAGFEAARSARFALTGSTAAATGVVLTLAAMIIAPLADTASR